MKIINAIVNLYNKAKYLKENIFIAKHNFNLLGKCYTKSNEEYTTYIKIVAKETSEDNNLVAMHIVYPNNFDHYDNDVISTDKYGPYVEAERFPAYVNINIDFKQISIDDLNDYIEIDNDEFNTTLTFVMDVLLHIG